MSDMGTALGGTFLGYAILIGLLVALLAAVAVCQRLHRHNRRLTQALGNTPQGLCMWDASGRLLVCNERYLTMYGMSPKVVRPGRSLRDILVHRTEIGNFAGDVDKYVADPLAMKLLGGEFGSGDSIRMDVSNAGSLSFVKQ